MTDAYGYKACRRALGGCTASTASTDSKQDTGSKRSSKAMKQSTAKLSKRRTARKAPQPKRSKQTTASQAKQAKHSKQTTASKTQQAKHSKQFKQWTPQGNCGNTSPQQLSHYFLPTKTKEQIHCHITSHKSMQGGRYEGICFCGSLMWVGRQIMARSVFFQPFGYLESSCSK